MFSYLLLFVLPIVQSNDACNECFCFGKANLMNPSLCHSYYANLQKFYYGNEFCLALQPGDFCYPKVFKTLAACEAACKRFIAMAKEWKTWPMID